MGKYYQLTDAPETADLYIFGDIDSWAPYYGDGAPDQSGYTIVRELERVEAPRITVHINSYGGDVSEGLAIYNTLKSSGKEITTVCDGFACSAASVVFMAGSRRVMQAASLLMIHNAWGTITGNAAELRKWADDLETITAASINAYMERVTISREEVTELMDKESWILPQDAVDMGFATEVRSEAEDGVRQSAMHAIMQKLTEPAEAINLTIDEQAILAPKQTAKEIAKEIADAILEKLEQRSREKTKPPIPDGWDDFFD